MSIFQPIQVILRIFLCRLYFVCRFYVESLFFLFILVFDTGLDMIAFRCECPLYNNVWVELKCNRDRQTQNKLLF